ncbi:MAG TPA: barstar family protein [Pseudomonas sp.]|nr:barstar family protein [Pseudomonas sp.]
MTPHQLTERLLADKRRCGVYRIATAWGPDASDPALDWKTLQPLPRIDRDTLLAALGATLQFPDYYGQNWDAAWDCLTDLDWPAEQLLVVHLPIPADCPVVEDDLAVFLELLADACQHWAERGQALCLLVESRQPELPALTGIPFLDERA